MIVKNESACIRRTLEAVKPLISCWIIVDTGSTDGTQEIIRDVLKDIPGELHERPWVNFEHNRNEALELARGKGDYIFFLDADDLVEIPKGYAEPTLESDVYFIILNLPGNKVHKKNLLVRSSVKCFWSGVIHEFLIFPEGASYASLSDISIRWNAFRDGSRDRDCKTFQRDIQLLQKLVKKEPYNTRYSYYLAVTYLYMNRFKLAMRHYKKRVEIGFGDDEELFWALITLGVLYEKFKKTSRQITDCYKRAFLVIRRKEPLFYLARFLRKKCKFEKAYEIAYQGLLLPKFDLDELPFFAMYDAAIYEYGLALEFIACAYSTKHYDEALQVLPTLLANKNLPEYAQKEVLRYEKLLKNRK
jgi:glycosyltransferase involved in cell wall biosynthesis